jgi:transposase
MGCDDVDMPKRDGAVHVATTRRVYKGKTYQTHLLRRTYREGDKVKHQTLRNLSHLPPDLIDVIRDRLRGEPPRSGDRFEIIRTLPHGHVAAVLGTLQKIGLEETLGSRPSPERTLSVAMIVARVINARSKLATARALAEETAASSLALELGIESTTEDALYAAMDWLLEQQERIEKKLSKKHLEDGSLILYDSSSSYYTGTHCALAKFGHNRDGKNGFPQIVYGLLCNAEGCPVAVEVFEGNTADPKTLSVQIEKVRKRFHLKRVVFVGDRGMITTKRIKEELRKIEGLDWISALRSEAIKKLAEEKVIQLSLFDERDLVEISSPEYPGERLVVCRNPFLAEERAHKRQELLEATEKKLEVIAAATKRAKRPFRGKDKIGLRVGRVINRYKVGKHFILEITEESFSYQRNLEKITAEAALDGLYVIRTSVPKETLCAESTVRAYKDLSKVERAFRSLKTVDLKVRPIYHWDSDRVRAHVFLCMLAYYVEWHMRQKLAPILFDDEEKKLAEGLRDSVVKPAVRSETAQKKDFTKRTSDGQPVHSLRSLLDDLGTLAKNRVRAPGTNACEFYLLTRPTELQARALDLLGVTVSA